MVAMMRGEAERISGVLDEIEAAFREASGVPMRRGKAVVDRADLLALIDELKGLLPAEVVEAEAVRRECGAVISEAEERAGRIVEEAKREAQVRALETGRYHRAERMVEEILEHAERYAEEVASGAEVYQERVLEQLESWFQDSIESVSESRRELGAPVLQRSGRLGRGEDEPGEGWRANSA